MATWYKSGTVNVTNGSTAVVGVGTLWQLNGITTGDLFTLDGDTFYEIAAVTGETAITLASNYGGTTQTGQTYAIIRNMTNTTNAELATKVSTLLNAWQTRENEFRAWHGGTVSGGPGSDGKYPLTDALGNTQNIACPAKLAANVLSPSLDTLSVDAAYKTLIVDSVNHRVGVGTATPTEKLDVSGNAKVSGTLAINGSTIHLNYASAGYNRNIYGSTNGSYRWGMRLGNSAAESGSNAGSDFELNRYDDAGSYIESAVYVRRNNGKVGIGTVPAVEKLEVAGNIKAINNSSLIMAPFNATQSLFNGYASAAGTYILDINAVPYTGSDAASIRLFRSTSTTGTTALRILKGDGSTTENHILTGNANTFLCANNGNIRIGDNTTPTEKLEVLGIGKFTQGIKLGSGTTALSNYEEGVWVPSLIGSSVAGDQGYAVQVGRYTRIGRMVFFTATISLFSKDAAMSGQIRITGLPVSAAATGCAQGCDIGSVGGVTLATGYTMLTAQIDSGADYIRLMQAGSGQFVNVIQAADVSATFAITISGSYEV